MKKITKKINIEKLVENYPESVEIMFEYGLGCVGCMAASGENLEDGAKAHGLSDKKIDEMVEKINKNIK